MTDYTIAEEYTLPSLGKVYSENVNPIVKLKSMTTNQEMKRLAPSERSYKTICEKITNSADTLLNINHLYDITKFNG